MKYTGVIILLLSFHYSHNQECGGASNDIQDQCGGALPDGGGQCGGDAPSGLPDGGGQCGGDAPSGEGGCGGGDYTEKDAFLDMVGAGSQGAGGCGGGTEEGEGQCGGAVPEDGQCGGEVPEDGQCGGGPQVTSDASPKETFYDVVGAGNEEGGCGGGGGNEQQGGEGQCGGDTPDAGDEGGSFISNMLGDFFANFAKTPENKRREEFGKNFPDIDTNKDEQITSIEVYKWIRMKMENDANQGDFSMLKLDKIDTNKDGKISWKEYEVYQKKEYSDYDEKKLALALHKDQVRFNYVDINKDGFMSKDEYPRLAMPDSFQDMDEMVLEHFLIDHDVNNDGIVTVDELKQTSTDDPLIYDADSQFDDWDKNNDKQLSKDEARRLAYDFIATPHIQAELKAVFDSLDNKKKGWLSYDEFMDGYEFFTDLKKAIPQDLLQRAYEELK